jgi:hypothetical protein
MRALGVLLLVLVTGCNHMRLDYSSAASTTSSGTAASASSGALQVQGGRPLAVVILGGLLLATAVDGDPRPLLFSDTSGMRPAPEMNPDRSINEQDCTKPIELSGNLKCR